MQVLIVGAGIVGICAAARLAEAGHDVAVVDRTGVCAETSSGNAAALAFPEILPLAQQGMLAQVPRWLADPLGPLSIPPAYLPRLLPWLWRFWRAGRQSRRERSIVAQAALMELAEPEWLALMDRSGTREMLREDGCLELYESEGEWREALPGWGARARHGIDFDHLRGADIAALQPGLSERFAVATFVPGWKTVADPKLLGEAVWRHAEAKGARMVDGVVVSAGLDGERPYLRLSNGRRLDADRLVVAAGAWSHLIARHFGDRVPLETERGYNTTLPPGAFDLKRQLVFPGHGFVATPLETGVRIGGAVELAGLERAPNFARSRAMLEKAKRFMPGLNVEGGTEWMGYRPSLPDSLPVIGRSTGAAQVILAFGHGHLGLTQAAATGRLVLDLVEARKPAIDLAPYRPDRF